MLQIRIMTRSASSILIAVVMSFMLSACAIKLAPDYDEGVVAKLGAINEKMSSYFASFDSAASYESRKGFYDESAGQVMALTVALKARPMPQSVFFDWLGSSQAEKKVADIIRNSDAPSIGSLESIIGQIQYMRDADKENKLSKAKVDLTRGVVESHMVDAMTYEIALKR